MTKKLISCATTFSLLALLTVPLHSVEVEVSGTKKIAVEISAFQGAEAALVQKIVSDDLRRTSMIEPVSSNGSFSVVGSVNGGSLIGKLADTSRGSEVFSKNYSGDFRKMAHEFADDILESLTQVKGFSTSRIAFISGTQGAKELYTMDIDGANIKRLTNDKSISANPAWSNDGTSIAYMSYRSGYPDVYVIKLAQGIRTRVAGF
ncbi:MAG: biopolymer transporter Tol, partial [Verrucomicrobiota bacterium]